MRDRARIYHMYDLSHVWNSRCDRLDFSTSIRRTIFLIRGKFNPSWMFWGLGTDGLLKIPCLPDREAKSYLTTERETNVDAGCVNSQTIIFFQEGSTL